MKILVCFAISYWLYRPMVPNLGNLKPWKGSLKSVSWMHIISSIIFNRWILKVQLLLHGAFSNSLLKQVRNHCCRTLGAQQRIFFKLKLFVEMIIINLHSVLRINTERSLGNCSFPHSNILKNCSRISQLEYWHWQNLLILLGFPQFYLYSYVYKLPFFNYTLPFCSLPCP